jgi:DNA polymerase III epsilon subunit-like protein
MTAVVFLDTETTGLHPITDHIWEVAALRVEEGKPDESYVQFVDHAPPGVEYLGTKFADDYKARYDPLAAQSRANVVTDLRHIFRGRAHLVGAVPSFDAERLGVMRRLAASNEPDPWHYHLIDVEALAVGYLRGKLASDGPTWGYMHASSVADVVHTLPWDSNELSNAVGVDPEQFARHTAMGDVLWVKAIYDAVMNP